MDVFLESAQTRPSCPPHLRAPDTDPAILAEKKFRALAQASAQVVWVAEANGQITEDSPSWRNFTGQSLAEWRGTGWLDVLHPDDRECVLSQWRSAVATQTRYETRYRLRHASGEWRWMAARGIPVFDHAGLVTCWVGLSDDITLQISAENGRAESELHFRSLAETVSDLVWIAGVDAQIFYWSPSWYEYTGLTPSESLGLRAAELVHEDHRAAALESWAAAVAADDRFEMELPLRGRDGRYRWFNAKARPVKDKTGRTVRWTGSLSNVDELRSALDALRLERRERELFVASLVHDIRSAFAQTEMANRAAQDPGIDAAERSLCLDIAARASDRIHQMVTDLLDANTLQAGQAYRPKKRERIGLRSYLEEYCRDWAAAPRARIAIECDEEAVVDCGRQDLGRMLGNLLSNAAKYGDVARTITVGVSTTGPQVALRVHNWGKPIPEEQQTALFGFLKRAEDVEHRPGWGIGLTLVKGLVEGYGGAVHVSSCADQGTTFTLQLPRPTDGPDRD